MIPCLFKPFPITGRSLLTTPQAPPAPAPAPIPPIVEEDGEEETQEAETIVEAGENDK